jgi:ribonuclease HI
LRYAARLQFTKETDTYTNNIVEYEAVLLGLHMLRVMGVQNCILRIDSMVIAGRIEKECIARGCTLERYLALIRRMKNYFEVFSIEHIDRSNNIEADALAKVVARKTSLPPHVFFQTLEDSSVKTIEPEPNTINIFQEEDWCALIIVYLIHHYESSSQIELLRMQQRAKAYQVIGNELRPPSWVLFSST